MPAPPHTGFTAQGVGVKALHPALAIIWSWMWVKAGFLNTVIPSATSCIPNHFLFPGVLAVLPSEATAPLGVPWSVPRLSVSRSQNLDPTECFIPRCSQ